MSLKNKFQNWFYLEDEDEEENPARQREEQNPPRRREEQRPIPEQTNRASRPKKQTAKINEEQQSARVVSLQSVQKSSKVILVEPRVYAEAQDISEHLKNKRAVVVNLQRIEREQGIRIIDFLSGTVYSLGGDIQRIGTDIFLCVPDNVEVAGAISDYFEQ